MHWKTRGLLGHSCYLVSNCIYILKLTSVYLVQEPHHHHHHHQSKVYSYLFSEYQTPPGVSEMHCIC